jgi:hypothetical protein
MIVDLGASEARPLEARSTLGLGLISSNRTQVDDTKMGFEWKCKLHSHAVDDHMV